MNMTNGQRNQDYLMQKMQQKTIGLGIQVETYKEEG